MSRLDGRSRLFTKSNQCVLGVLVLVLPLLVSSCATATRLVPAPSAERVPGEKNAAVEEVDGVRITVTPNAWLGVPNDLDAEMTPLKVTIENRSNHSLRIRYTDFSLSTSAGVRYVALPPYKITGSADDRAATVPRFTYYGGFFIAPIYSPFFTTLTPWNYAWPPDRYYYDEFYPAWLLQLPTRDMREQAIPEGVVDPRGGLSGFLYFPKLARGTTRVAFDARLTDGKTTAQFGELRIPFNVS
jgi:hypothetical protein